MFFVRDCMKRNPESWFFTKKTMTFCMLCKIFWNKPCKKLCFLLWYLTVCALLMTSTVSSTRLKYFLFIKILLEKVLSNYEWFHLKWLHYLHLIIQVTFLTVVLFILLFLNMQPAGYIIINGVYYNISQNKCFCGK